MHRGLRAFAKRSSACALLGLSLAFVVTFLITSPAADAVTIGPLSFKASAFDAHEVSPELRPFYSPTPAEKRGTTDMVVMRVINGVAYDMPLRQAESGYNYLNAYDLTGDTWYLDKARTQAEHLISIQDTQGTGWFFPNTFSFGLDARYAGGTLVPPWYSGIAQGAAVGFLARMWETTGEQRYRDAAEHTMMSFLVPRTAARPWVSRIDSLGYLRLEEYPSSRWGFVLNGHMEAAMGLYDYYRITGDTRALWLYRGALTSIARYGNSFRNPGWISAYSLGSRAPYVHYHRWHIRQFVQIWSLSGDARFLRLANDYDVDYPAHPVSGVIALAPGSYTAYRFSSTGSVVSARRIQASAGRLLNGDARVRVRGRSGYWLTIAGGPLNGYRLLEVPGRVFFRGPVGALSYRGPARVELALGTCVAQSFDSDGGVANTLRIRVATRAGSSGTQRVALDERPALVRATVDRRAVVNGVYRYRLSSGPLTGYWITQGAAQLR